MIKDFMGQKAEQMCHLASCSCQGPLVFDETANFTCQGPLEWAEVSPLCEGITLDLALQVVKADFCCDQFSFLSLLAYLVSCFLCFSSCVDARDHIPSQHSELLTYCWQCLVTPGEELPCLWLTGKDPLLPLGKISIKNFSFPFCKRFVLQYVSHLSVKLALQLVLAILPHFLWLEPVISFALLPEFKCLG